MSDAARRSVVVDEGLLDEQTEGTEDERKGDMSVGKSAASRKRSSSGLGRLLRQGGNGFGRTRYFVQSVPVVLAPCPSNTGGGRAMSSAQYTRASPMLKIRWDRNNEQSNEQLEFIEYAGVQLEALDLRLEERMLQHLYKFVVQCSSIFVAQEHGAADTAPVRVPGEAVALAWAWRLCRCRWPDGRVDGGNGGVDSGDGRGGKVRCQ